VPGSKCACRFADPLGGGAAWDRTLVQRSLV
jgi:hypothetical protein